MRVNDALHATAEQKLDDIARDCGFDGRLVVLAEPDIAPGDCRIEWADGGVSARQRRHRAGAIDEAVARYRRRAASLHARRQCQTFPGGQPMSDDDKLPLPDLENGERRR